MKKVETCHYTRKRTTITIIWKYKTQHNDKSITMQKVLGICFEPLYCESCLK